jgi:hypothetical protein
MQLTFLSIAHGADFDMHMGRQGELPVKHIWTETDSPIRPTTKRAAERRRLSLPARLMWKDQRGTPRFASVVTHNVSEFGVYVECPSPVSISPYRLVQFQLEPGTQHADEVPDSLRSGRVLSAVYRVTPRGGAGLPQGLALRLMVEPRRRLLRAEPARATA